MKQPKLKICGMREPTNMLAVSALMPDYMGFIFYPRSKRYAAHLSSVFTRKLPKTIKKTGVFVDEDIEKVQERLVEFELSALQLHGEESPSYCAALKVFSPETEVIKAFGVEESFDFESLIPYANMVDYFLFDTQTPDHGGSGKRFDWALLESYTLDVPYFLSGGIGLDSVAEIRKIKDERLYAIDINSKFELEPGLKNLVQLTEFKNQLFR